MSKRIIKTLTIVHFVAAILVWDSLWNLSFAMMEEDLVTELKMHRHIIKQHAKARQEFGAHSGRPIVTATKIGHSREATTFVVQSRGKGITRTPKDGNKEFEFTYGFCGECRESYRRISEIQEQLKTMGRQESTSSNLLAKL